LALKLGKTGQFCIKGFLFPHTTYEYQFQMGYRLKGKTITFRGKKKQLLNLGMGNVLNRI
jgi:hypothetical protein